MNNRLIEVNTLEHAMHQVIDVPASFDPGDRVIAEHDMSHILNTKSFHNDEQWFREQTPFNIALEIVQTSDKDLSQDLVLDLDLMASQITIDNINAFYELLSDEVKALLTLKVSDTANLTTDEPTTNEYHYITLEFDGPIMNNDKLRYENITIAEMKNAFERWCEGYNVTVESTNPRIIDFDQKH